MKKEKIITISLFLMMIFMSGLIFYFSYLLMEAPTEEKNTSSIAPKKTKAEVATSERFIALNQNTSNNDSSTNTPTPTEVTVSNQNSVKELDDNQLISPTEIPTPTEIILAKVITPTPTYMSSTNNYYLSPTILSPTEIKNLPNSGSISYSFIFFAIALFLIFYSLFF